MARIAVIGYPVGHSRSPAMQNAALAELGLSEECAYDSVEVGPERFAEKVRELASSDYVGANVTVPYKEAALSLADKASEVAREIGAANTLSFYRGAECSGPIIAAENTDAGGLLASLPRSPRGRRALVLGAGGAARAVVWALAREGAEVAVWNRTASRAEAIAAAFGGIAVAAPSIVEYELVVNTSVVGLRGEDPFEHLPLAPTDFKSDQVVLDMVYGEHPSLLLAAADAAGAATVDGLEVLLHQGALSLEVWTGRKAPIGVMRAALGC